MVKSLLSSLVIRASTRNPHVFRPLLVHWTCQTSVKSAEQEHVSKYLIIITIHRSLREVICALLDVSKAPGSDSALQVLAWWWLVGLSNSFSPKIWQQQIPRLLQRGQIQRILVGRNYWSVFLLAYSWILDKAYWGLSPNFSINTCQPVSEWVQCDLEDPGLFSLLKNSIRFFAWEHYATNHSCKTKVPVKPQLVCLSKGSGFFALAGTASHKSQPKTAEKEVIQFASQLKIKDSLSEMSSIIHVSF